MTPSWRAFVGRTGIAGRRSGLHRIAGVAIMTAAAVILHPSTHAGAETGRTLEISVDYDRACGDRNGRAIYPWKRAATMRTSRSG